jgi:23S rRNA (pseudouridine1915-N3)-methyltransferase
MLFSLHSTAMNIEIWSIGKENESFIDDGVRYYFEKTRPYCNISLHILQANRKQATNDVERMKAQEEEMVLKKLTVNHYLLVLDERGKQLNSIDWSKQMQQMMNMGTKTLVLLIGGAYGVSENIRKQAKQVWSLSPLIFPHQLVRLIVAEQVYRAFSILNNSPYHHS